MKLVQLVKSGCAVSVALVVFTGCASFPKNQLPIAQLQLPNAGLDKPTVSYSFTSGVEMGAKQEHADGVRTFLENEFLGVLNKSGQFGSATKLGDQGDIDVQARLVNSGSPAALFPAFLTGLSLYTIPSWVTDKYCITAKVTTRDKKEYRYELVDSMTTVQWLPLIVVAPFKNMIKVSKNVRENMWKNLIVRMEKEGVLAQLSATAIESKAMPVSQVSKDPSDAPAKLKRLRELKDSGVLTEEEYQAKRTALIERI